MINDFDFIDEVQGMPITGIRAKADTATGRFQEINVRVGHNQISFQANQDTDEVLISFGPATIADEPLANDGYASLLSDMIGREVGWLWKCVNSQGYTDTVLLGCPTIVPRYVIHAIASSLCIGEITMHGIDNVH
jgi:hypothetical protein